MWNSRTKLVYFPSQTHGSMDTSLNNEMAPYVFKLTYVYNITHLRNSYLEH